MKMLDNLSAKAVFLFKITGNFFPDEVLCIYCATHSVSFLVSPFVQLKGKSKMATRYHFFSMATNLQVVPPGTCFLGSVQ